MQEQEYINHEVNEAHRVGIGFRVMSALGAVAGAAALTWASYSEFVEHKPDDATVLGLTGLALGVAGAVARGAGRVANEHRNNMAQQLEQPGQL